MSVTVGSLGAKSASARITARASGRPAARARSWRTALSIGTALRPRALDLAIVQLAGVCVALGGIEVVLLLVGRPGAPRWVALLWPMCAAIYLAAGVVAWLRRPTNRIGAVMIFGAIVCLGAGLANVTVPALVVVGMVVAMVPVAIIAHLMLAFPSGVLRGRLSLVTVAAGYLTCTVLQAPQYLYGPPSPLQIADRPDLANAGLHLQWAVGASLVALMGFILLRRRPRARTAQRGTFVPLFLYGLFAVLFVPVSAQLERSLFPGHTITLATAQVIVLAGVPVAFVAAMLRGGFAKAAGLEELGEWLGTNGPARDGLDGALADALGDHSIQLAFWVTEAGGYVDHDGRPVTLPTDAPDRAVVEVSLGQRHVGAICYDSSLIDDPGDVIRAGRMIAMALDNERLLVELRASREQLRASRARIVEACDRERRQVARDFHDGLQARLVLLAIKAHAICTDPAPELALRRDGAALEADLQTAITDLRELVHGVMPAALTERGLCAAVEELTDRIPIPTKLRFNKDGARLPSHVESTCYFVIAEALSNAVKHSGATELLLTLERSADMLRIELCDDGVGGVRTGGGVGVRGMADRIEALDGHLTIDSPPRGGTRIIVEVPCE